MSAFIGIAGHTCRTDKKALHALTLALAPFGDVVCPDVADGFQALHAAASIEKQTNFASNKDGLAVVGRVFLTARKELVQDLEASPESADIALILLAYRRWGRDLLLHVQGEFAFVLYDSAEHLVLAATDHFSARPLFYASSSMGLLLSDSVPALRDSGLCDVALDEKAVGDYLSIGFITDEQGTAYRGIRRLAPGTRMVAKNNQLQIRAYWKPPAQEKLLLMSRIEEYAELFRSVLLKTVAERIPASGEIGLMLSGGMDSTSIAACLCHAIGRDRAADRVTAFTYVSSMIREHEGEYSTSVARHLGIRHRVFELEDAIEKSQRSCPATWPPNPSLQPPSLATSLPGLEMIERGGRLFSGHGGDELLRPSGRDLQRIVSAGAAGAPYQLARHWIVAGQAPTLGFRSYLSHTLRATGTHFVPVWLDPNFAKRTGLEDRLSAYLATHTKLRDRLRGPFWSNLLSFGVSSLTGAPFDVAYPFFDLRLLRLIARFPDNVLVNKGVLREAMSTFLPAEVLQRPKTPFGSPKVQLQTDPEQQSRQSALLLEHGSAIAEFVNLDLLRRALASPEVETITGLNRIETFLRWIRQAA